jgi:hypothetical protein
MDIFWRFHPITGADANSIDTSQFTAQQKNELAEMVRAGARFYWEKRSPTSDDPEEYGRVEYSNVKFVLDVMGMKYEFLDTAQ